MRKPFARYVCLLLLLTLSFVLGGCFQATADITVHEDGSVSARHKLVGVNILKNDIELSRLEVQQKNPEAKIQPVVENQMMGYTVEEEFSSLAEMVKTGSNIFKPNPERATGISCHEGWLFDDYQFDLLYGGGLGKVKAPGGDSAQRAAQAGALFSITLHLPSEPISHNAGQVMDDGKTLYWDLTPMSLTGADMSVQAVFRIWHKAHVALTVLVVIAAAALCIFLYRKGEGKAKLFSALAAAVAVVITIGSLYAVQSAPQFTESDRLETAQEMSQSANTEKAELQSKSADKKAMESPAAKAKEHVTSATSLGPVSIGDNFAEQRELLGKEAKPSSMSSAGDTQYFYQDLEVHVRGGAISEIYSNNDKVHTQKGIKQGDSLQKVLSTYGQPNAQSKYEDLDLYEYEVQSRQGKKCLLRFAIKNDKVDYISVRLA